MWATRVLRETISPEILLFAFFEVKRTCMRKNRPFHVFSLSGLVEISFRMFMEHFPTSEKWAPNLAIKETSNISWRYSHALRVLPKSSIKLKNANFYMFACFFFGPHLSLFLSLRLRNILWPLQSAANFAIKKIHMHFMFEKNVRQTFWKHFWQVWSRKIRANVWKYAFFSLIEDFGNTRSACEYGQHILEVFLITKFAALFYLSGKCSWNVMKEVTASREKQKNVQRPVSSQTSTFYLKKCQKIVIMSLRFLLNLEWPTSFNVP